MWKFKDNYKGKRIFVSGFGTIDFSKETPETMHKLSLQKGKEFLIKYIEKDAKEDTKTTIKAEKPTK